jgi:hypothetical protein
MNVRKVLQLGGVLAAVVLIVFGNRRDHPPYQRR